MDETCSESDVSLSPSQILERLQVLRQLQLLQRGKLQKQRLQYKETSETSSSITEIVSHFSNSTSYNTFRSLLQSSNDISTDGTPRLNTSNLSQKLHERDLIEGVSVLNLSQESEFLVSSPISSRSRGSAPSRNDKIEPPLTSLNNSNRKKLNSSGSNCDENAIPKKHISLDEMPILSPKQDFEALLLEKLQHEKNVPKSKSPKTHPSDTQTKRPFLKRGEGMARFGVKKSNLIIQNTKSLPWKRRPMQNKNVQSPCKIKQNIKSNKQSDVEIIVAEPQTLDTDLKTVILTRKSKTRLSESSENSKITNNTEIKVSTASTNTNDCSVHSTTACSIIDKPTQKVNFQKPKHPLIANKGNTWAAVLTKEQDDFLRQLKQSDYYKNFTSPAKSIVSDVSCDETSKLCQDKELAEQNLFDLIENKVSHDSFNIESSFFNRFLRRSNLECSGESTPLVLQKCLAQNPDLMHIHTEMLERARNESHSDAETCCGSYTDCCSDTCSSVSCCSCKTVEPANNSTQNCNEFKEIKKKVPNQGVKTKKVVQIEVENKSHDDIVTENDIMKENMAEMNAKLISTSELLKDRLRELEDEIETFRKENASLAKLREDVDQERQRFYEEKAAFEQKYNEEKVLSEYYLAEEKEKLAKQKQMYDRYVREIRGRLNKKDKDEVVNLKKEINDLKEEIRLRDAKSTSTIARLRNQIKSMEKEKKDINDEVEKLKKQNRRIQHSNEVTRRLTNIKYLEQINKKLNNMSSKDAQSEVRSDRDIKYKAYEIERQSRKKKVEPVSKGTLRPRAKSVPNLNVTSRYAKYFSQRDTISTVDYNKLNVEGFDNSNNDNIDNDTLSNDSESLNDDVSVNADDNHLEQIYIERFRSSPRSNRSSASNSDHIYLDKPNVNENAKGFFINKSNSTQSSKSPKRSLSPYLNHSGTSLNRSKSPVSILSNKSNGIRSPNMHYSSDYLSYNSTSNHSQNRSKSQLSHSNQSSQNHRTETVIHNDQYRDRLNVVSPEPSTSKTSITKTSLNPTEIRNPDGSRELRFPNGNIKHISADGKYSKFVYYNGDVKENFFNEGRIKYYYAETKTFHTTHADGLEVMEFPDGQVEKRYNDGSTEIRLPNGSVRYFDPKNEHVREEWRFPDGATMTVSSTGEQRIVFKNGQIEVHAKDHKRREFPDGTVKLVYIDGTAETRYASGRVRIKDKHGNLIMDSATG